MARIDGGEMVVRALERQGVRDVFALSGGHLDPIFQACERHGIRLVDTRHEAAAAHMADGYARVTGRPGVCFVTAGPGVTNALTGIANAWMDAIPLVCIGGRSPLRDDDRLPLQGMDQVALMRPITKFARTVLHPERIPEYIAAAWRHAVSGRPGPVFLDIPVDVLFSPVDEDQLPTYEHYAPEGRPTPTTADIERLVDLFARAERPVILAGGGAMFSGASPELREFASLARVPVLMGGKARGTVSERTELGFSGFGLMASPVVRAAAGPADLVVLLGARLGMYTGSSGGRGSVIPPEATLVQVDVEGEEIGRCQDVQVGLVADVRETLRLLIERGRGRQFADHERWIEALGAARAAQRGIYDSQIWRSEGPIHQGRLAREIAEYLSGEDILVADGGEPAAWMGDQAVVEHPGHWLSHGYLGCLGTGIPFGIAARVARPDRRALVISGDGSVGLNFAEFDTAVRHGLPVVVVVNNDHGWGMIRHGQAVRYDKVVGAELGPVRYDVAASGFGVHAEQVVEASEIRPALDRAFSSGLPACLNVMSDPTQPHYVTVGMTQRSRPQPQEKATDDDGEVDLPYYGRRAATSTR